MKKKSYCIPKEELDNVVTGMYLNIVEYVDPEKQDVMLERIDMESKTEGVIEGLINQGVKQTEKKFVCRLLEKFSVNEVANLLGISLTELNNILKR